MKLRGVIALIAFVGSPASATMTDWSQPPVGCVEEVLPNTPDRPCLDLSKVVDPGKDWPAEISETELQYWKSAKGPTQYCRAREFLAREDANPGSISAGKVQVSWMQIKAVEQRDKKIKSVYSATRANAIPPQILTGALFQESLFAELGIESDGGNYSCGVGQINVQEWCRWANEQPTKLKVAIDWPSQAVDCSIVPTNLVKSFHDIALTKLGGLPEYRLNKSHFQGIEIDDVIGSFPAAPQEQQETRFRAIRSFVHHCSESEYGIAAKANELASLYRNFVPDGLKKVDVYSSGESYNRVCSEKVAAKVYPLQSAWLLAVGIYNSGPRAVDALAHYQKWSSQELKDPATWIGFTPHDLVESFYWTGKYSPKTDKIHFKTLKGVDTSWIWFKTCVLQRHIARVVQHVTLSGHGPLIDSLEGSHKCALSVFDADGGLVKSAVPPFRQSSPGIKID